MYKMYKYNGVVVSKRDWELIQFIQTGSNNFTEAYYIYTNRKPKSNYDVRFFASWFNRTLKNIQRKGLLREIPYVYRVEGNGFIWANPGINASKANFECLTLHDAVMEQRMELNKILV